MRFVELWYNAYEWYENLPGERYLAIFFEIFSKKYLRIRPRNKGPTSKPRVFSSSINGVSPLQVVSGSFQVKFIAQNNHSLIFDSDRCNKRPSEKPERHQRERQNIWKDTETHRELEIWSSVHGNKIRWSTTRWNSIHECCQSFDVRHLESL